MSTNNISTKNSLYSNAPTGWSKEQVTEEAVNHLLMQKLKEIASSYMQRKQADSIQGLVSGPWYQNDYALALQKHRQTSRLDYLVKKNAFYHGFAPKGFDQEPNSSAPTKFTPLSYQIQKDVLPTEALANVKTGQFSFIDCGTAIALARFETLREVFGANRFNDVFSGKGAFPLKLDRDITKTPLTSLGLVKEETFNVNAISPKLGDTVHFSNIPLYKIKHPNGEATGFNTVCISEFSEKEKKYIAFGLPAEGKTENEMSDVLMNEFNAKPITPSLIFTEDMIKHSKEQTRQREGEITEASGQDVSDVTINREEFEWAVNITNHMEAGMHPTVHRFDIQAIRKQL